MTEKKSAFVSSQDSGVVVDQIFKLSTVSSTKKKNPSKN